MHTLTTFLTQIMNERILKCYTAGIFSVLFLIVQINMHAYRHINATYYLML